MTGATGEKLNTNSQKSLADLVSQAKVENRDIVPLLKENYVVVEVAV